jgi:2,7-dihydroxy-5-methyl-1-naphthoate 7-O-methyltransferase
MTSRDSVDLEALSDLCTPWCLRVVATLRIADHIAAGTAEIDKLASAAGCDADALNRVLRHLVGKGLFQQSAPGRFELNDAARGLLDDAECRGLTQRLGLDLDGIGGRLAHAWSSLLPAVRTGRSAYHEVFGLPFWEDLDAHPDVAAEFDELIAAEYISDPDVLVDSGWDSVETVVDVGGGTGTLLAEILRVNPEIRGILVDLPRTVARSATVFRAAGVDERTRAVGQSFFDPLPSGDLYILRSVLADWADREATTILSRCAEAARPNAGRVVVLSGVSPDPGGTAGDLLEMVMLGGKHRTFAEFNELARMAHLDVVAAECKPSGRFVIECRPADV